MMLTKEIDTLRDRTAPIDLGFLGEGRWQAEVFGDEPDNPAAFHRETKPVTSKEKLTLSLRQRGGAVVWIRKAN